MKIINLGFDNCVAAARVVCIADAHAAPMKRLREEAQKNHKLVDVTSGRRTRSIVITDSGHVILSGMQPATLTQRLEEAK
ncbi:MAG: extracellular matrix/biofilm biosynthesis regulator RemA family protein [Candidatus Omnitrophota bacterium]